MRKAFVVIAAAIVTVLGTAADAGSLRADHPFIGTWRLTMPDNSCFEIYRIRADGTSLVTSGDEVGESEFEISDQPSAKGFYKWVDTVVKDNGKKDCAGETTQVGHVATNYLRFNPSANMFLMCQEEDINTCIGPLVRVKGREA